MRSLYKGVGTGPADTAAVGPTNNKTSYFNIQVSEMNNSLAFRFQATF